MEDVLIITRDINGKRKCHYLIWDVVCQYIQNEKLDDEYEILLIIIEGTCVWSALTSPPITWEDVTGFFG